MAQREPTENDASSYVRRSEPLDMITECPPLVFWTLCYLPGGILLSIIFNSVAPLFIMIAVAYLTSDALDQ